MTIQESSILNDLESNFANFLENTLEGIWILDLSRNVVFANTRMEHILGTGKNELSGDRLWDFIPKDDEHTFISEIEKVLETGESIQTQISYRSETDSSIFCLLHMTPVFDSSARVSGIIGKNTQAVGVLNELKEDLDFHKKDEKSSRKHVDTKRWKNEQRHRIAVSAMNLGVFEWHGPMDTMIWENQRMYEIFGRDTKEGPFTWEYFYDHVIDPEDADRFKQALEEAMYPERVFQTTCRIRRQSDGEKRWTAFSGKFHMAEDGTLQGLTGVVSDITHRKEVEEDRKRLNENLEQQVADKTAELTLQADRLRALANRLARTEQLERKRLAHTLHDNIQPLVVSARMHLWEVKRQTGNDMESVKVIDKVDHILEESLVSLRSLTSDLGPPELKNTSFAGALNRLVTQMRAGYNLIVNLYADRPIYPDSEETAGLVFDCVKELLFNVVKHADTSEADVAISGMPGEMLTVVVSDGGAGFDKASLNTMDPGNMTFGLFSIQERLAYIGGEMQMKTAPGKGSKITLSVPAAKTLGPKPDSPAKDSLENPMQATGKGSLIEVLIVDDHKMLREGLKGMLQLESDLQVTGEASDGHGATAKSDRLCPDVVIMDVNLGEKMDGVAATREILTRHPGIKVIGLSMYDDENISAAMKEAGAAAYLPKSGTSDKLVETIRHVLH